ncbi:hypothetical protein [Sphingomonas sp. UNC305MFCol5.2]|uniref:hypothetical protein n=1 Tax=Sphingomonas sp. UNC305MFCol5.2 TaxID=1449076 RepID=UPI0003FEDA13|nr:hypothetical protein [Sphingomonas sp. UNC305MFCol5.2]
MRFGTFAVLTLFLLVNSCLGPTYQVTTLRAIKAESRHLIATYPIYSADGWVEVPKSALPPAIASLEPKIVMLRRNKVLIIILPFFDGGWGYEIVERRDALSMLDGCYSEPYPGVFWHGPC